MLILNGWKPKKMIRYFRFIKYLCHFLIIFHVAKRVRQMVCLVLTIYYFACKAKSSIRPDVR